MGLADSVKVSRDSTYSGYFGRRTDFAYGALTLYDSAVPNGFRYPIAFLLHYEVLLPQSENQTGLGSSAFARRYLRNRFFFLFLWVLRCFSSPGWLYEPMDSVHICSGIYGSAPV